MNLLFPPELRTAAVVQRWSIVRTLTDDSVSNHSFFVAFYTLQVARLIQWPGPYADLTFAALLHDAEEFITGDLVSPVKREIIDEGKYANFVSQQMKLRMPGVEAQLEIIMESMWGSSIDRIIKVADKIDAVLFLITEQRMGNAVLAPLHQDAMENLVLAWHDLGVETYIEEKDRAAHQDLWNNEIYPAIQAHWKTGSVGIQ